MGDMAKQIAHRLSLRKPQKESLDLLEKIVKTAGFDPKEARDSKLQKISALQIPKFSDFDRDFPSFAFALATGVGKTRLMGAFISYLFLAHGIKDYLLLAPNLTIYNKLNEDFSNPANPKYVFRGIGEFVYLPPKIITGDNYANVNTQRKIISSKVQSTFFGEEVHINIFNISKIDKEGGRIKKLSEYLGESYFSYLSNLQHLVVLMDESHRYRADRGMTIINEIKPILGLELTATPKVKDGNRFVPFKNIAFEYSLAQAIRDGFVKEPAVATRKNLDQKKLKSMDDDALDHLKLEDAVRVHENTKTHLLRFGRDRNLPVVKPFILVVAQNTQHAEKLQEYIKSHDFFDARYNDKVMTIHSNLKGEEKEENVELLLSLERPENPIEIVIHVNMLKEGWDVTNLYTIVPLRAFAADILTEQTLGRGLRLPYGEKTDDPEVDKLTVIAHDRFDELIKAAQDENSIILKQTIIDIDDPTFSAKQEVVQVTTLIEEQITKDEAKALTFKNEEEKKQALFEVKVKRAILTQLKGDSVTNTSIDPTTTDTEEMTKQIQEMVQSSLPLGLTDKASEEVVKKVTKSIIKDFLPDLVKSSIPIPRIIIQPKENSIRAGFKDFKLNTTGLPRFNPINDEILVKNLRDQQANVIGVINDQSIKDSNENLIVAKLIDYEEVDYETHHDLLYKLANEMLAYLRSYLKSEDDVSNVVLTQRTQIAEQLWQQMKDHFYCEVGEYEAPKIKPFTSIEAHNYSTMRDAEPKDFNVTLKTIADLKKTLFTGFKKSCHLAYKFDSFGEQKITQILEGSNEKEIEKWLRPAPRQFYIYWDHHTRCYEPDFVVETKKTIYMVEIKAKCEIDSKETQEKKAAALEYCRHASEYGKSNGGKVWRYVLIPDEEIQLNRDFNYFVQTFGTLRE